METIILAGGLGTRIRSEIGDIPKCMAPVNGRPFLSYLFKSLEEQNCTHVVLSLGYKHEMILTWLENKSFSFEIEYVIEDEPLGTGGGIQFALQKCKKEDVLIMNGDTMFQINHLSLFDFHRQKKSATTLALRTMHRYERYGSVNLDEDDCIISFEEKSFKENGLINGGIYIINKQYLLDKKLPEKFSFEKEYLEKLVEEKQFFGKTFDGYFIDIGIPEDYRKAQEDFKKLS